MIEKVGAVRVLRLAGSDVHSVARLVMSPV
jgi:hypothetical protein